MHAFAVQLTNQAAADLDKVPREARIQIVKDLSALAVDAFPKGHVRKKLKGFKFALYRLRAGNYRVLYRIDARLVTIMRVVNRKDLEKIAKRLKLS